MLPAKQHLGFLKDFSEVSALRCSLTTAQVESTSLANAITRGSYPFYSLARCFMAVCPSAWGTAVLLSDKPCSPVSLGFTHHSLAPDTERTIPLGEAFARLLRGPRLRCPCSPLPCSRTLGKPAPTYYLSFTPASDTPQMSPFLTAWREVTKDPGTQR